jgi:putative membrane protein
MKQTVLVTFWLVALAGESMGQGLSTAEKGFVTTAAKGNLAEVELGKLTSEKSNNQLVKDFGQQMVNDHSKANDNLKPIADSNGIQWPTKLTGESEALYNRLSKLSGAQFDKSYVQAMAQDHRKVLAEYKRESGTVKDQQLKAYIDQTLPVVQQHLSHIESIEKTASSSAQK